MESINKEVKPIPSVPGPPETIKKKPKQKAAHARYEDVWSEDVHAAFMEAIDIYPPMGQRRMRHVSILQDDKDGTVKSLRSIKWLGRCQLIQSYILEMTGKNRTRKQVSSHLQRLKKISKREPTKHPLFHDMSRFAQEPPNRGPSASSPEGTQSPDAVSSMHFFSGQVSPSDDMSPIVQCSEARNPGAMAGHESGFTYYVDNRRRSSSGELNSTALPQAMSPVFIGTTMQGDSANTGPEFSLTLRRPGNKLYSLPLESEGPTGVYSSQVHWSSGCQVPRRFVTRDNSSFTTMDFSYSYPLSPADRVVARDHSSFAMVDSPCDYQFTPVDQLFHTPLHPPRNFGRRRVVPKNSDGSCHWPFYADASGSLLDSDSYSSRTYTADIDLNPAPEPSLSFSDMQSSLFCMNGLHLEYENRYRARRLLSYSDAYDDAPYVQDLFATGISYDQLADYGLFHHPYGDAEEQLMYLPLIKPSPLYPAAYAHTEDCIPELSPIPAL